MQVVSREGFVYPGGECGVDVYQLAVDVLVVLKADGEAREGILALARAVRKEILGPEGLRGADLHWVYWDRQARVAYQVEFRRQGPEWHYLTPEEFARVVTAFEAPDPLQEMIEQGLDLESWEEGN